MRNLQRYTFMMIIIVVLIAMTADGLTGTWGWLMALMWIVIGYYTSKRLAREHE